MKKGYACIAYSIGRGINQRREIVEADPLPDSMTREEELIGERAS
jgi:hypothetical protein